MKINKQNPRHWWALLVQGCYCVLAAVLRPFLKRNNLPVVILYGHQLSGNLKALYDHFLLHADSEFETYFLSLDPHYIRELQNNKIQYLQCNSLKDMLTVGRSNVVITDHGLHAMSLLTTFSDIMFIDVWHGIPFKGFTPATFKVQRRYTEAWVSSKLLKDIYVDKFGFAEEKVQALGYARADKLFLQKPFDTRWKSALKIPSTNRVVLFAPTWQQENKGRSLFPFGETQDSFLSALDAICGRHNSTLVVRSHLNATITCREYEHVRYCSMKDFPDTETLLQGSDLLICDWSSIAFEFLALSRPALFLDVAPPFKNSFSLGPEYRYGAISSDMEHLAASLNGTLENEHSYWEANEEKHRQITSDIYDYNTDGRASERQLNRLLQLLGP